MGSIKRAISETGFPFSNPFNKRQRVPTMMNTSSYGYGSGSARRNGYASYNRNSYGSYNRRRRGGPYRVLTYGNKHTNPVYPKPELKYVDSAFPLANVTDTGNLTVPLNQMAQGTNGTQRIGLSTPIKSCTYRVDVRQAATTPLPSTVRIMLIWDKQPNQVQPAVTDVLQTANFNSYLNMANRERFVTLRNDYISLSPQGDQTVYIERFVKINMMAQYAEGAIPVQPAIINTTGALFLLFISDQNAAASQPRVSSSARVRFMDN